MNKHFRYSPVAAVLLIAFSMSSSSWAQQIPRVPGIGDAAREVEAARPTPQPQQTPTPITIVEEPPMMLSEGETLLVRAFKLQDAEGIDERDIQNVLAPYAGKNLTLAQINEAADKVTQLYRSRGYPVARAYVPKQDASNGTLTIQILIGRFGNISINNQSLVKRGSIIQSVFERLEKGQAITRPQLERAMLLIDDLPGARVPTITISPGAEHGTSDFDVAIPVEKRFAGYALTDNYGSRYTGRYRLSAGLDVHSPLGLGDQFSVGGLISEDIGLLSGHVDYSLPLSGNGLRANVGVYRTTYELGKEFSVLDATGHDMGVTLGLSYPLIRSQYQNLVINANATVRQLKDEIGVIDEQTKKKAYVGTLSARYESWNTLFNRGIYNSARLGLTFGRLSFDDPFQAAMNRLGADTEGSFSHVNLALNSRYSLTQKVSTLLTFTAQKALGGKNLDGSEQMSISGANGVRAYREGVSGDNAYFVNAEVRYQLPEVAALSHSLGVFAGTGRSHYENGDYVLENGVRLSDVGLSYVGTYNSTFYVKMQVTHAVGSRPERTYHDDRTLFLAQIGTFF